jgi:hypothetical protein
MGDGFSLDDVAQAVPVKPKPKPASSGFSLDSATKPLVDVDALHKELTKDSLVTKVSTKALTFLMDPTKNPFSIATGGWKAMGGGGKWLMEKAAEGIAGIATSSKWGGYNQEGAEAAAKQVQATLEFINTAPADKTEEAMGHFMGLLGEVPHIAGESVFDRTGSALAATGAETLSTLFLLSPELGAKILGKVEFTKGKPANPVSAAFDELAAKQPEVAESLAIHVGQVDPKLSKEMKAQLKASKKASDEALTIIGRNSADAATMHENVVTPKGRVTPESVGAPPMIADVQRHAEMLQRQEVERISSSIRTAAKEGLEALAEPPKLKVRLKSTPSKRTDMSLSPEERALERERVAAARAREEGHAREHEPEPVPRRAAEHEGEVGRRLAEDVPEIIYFNAGIPVTRAQVEAAFRFAGRLLEKGPGVLIAKGKMEQLYTGYIETFNPEAKGPAARTAGAAIARNFFDQAHREHVTWEQGKQRRTYWQKMGETASMQFIHGAEKGTRFDNPVWEKARLAYSNWADEILKQDMRTGFTYDPVDHYMPHLFKDGDGVLRFLQKRYGNKWADPRFIKERGYDLYQEAMDAGFTPKFTNPEEIMQARQQASDIAALRTDLLADLERKGVAVKAAKGAERPPSGYSPNSRRSPTGQRYWVMEELDPLMYNAFDSKSLWQGKGLKGEAFRGYMELKNKIIPIKLAASAFHPMHVLHIDAAAALTRETKLLGAGQAGATSRIGRFITQAATNLPYTPGSLYRSLWDNPRTGYPILRVFQGKRDFASLSEADKVAYAQLAETGMVPTRPKEETSSSMQRMKDSFHKREFASAAFHFPFAMLASLTHPVYSLWIPSLKIASVLKDMKVWRELNPEHTVMQRQEAGRRAAKIVESRYGEMNYNSMFMDKTIKDIGVATNLSLGWNIGLLDQYVGGAIDLGRAAGERGSLKSKLASGQLDRPIFASYYVGSALMLGGLMHYYFTGKQPTQLIDYTHPESGEKDQFGKPIRLNTMWYTREFEGLYKHMQQQGVVEGLSDFVINKGSGLVEMAKSSITGVDSLGQEIREPNDPAYKQLEQTLAYELADIESISLKAINLAPDANAAKMRALAVTGFNPAGRYISETVMEGQISNAYNKYVRPKEKPFQAVQMSKDVKELRGMFNSDDPKYDQKLDSMVKAYDLDDKDIHKLEKMFNSPKEQDFDPFVFQFSHLPWEVQKPLLDKMTKDEREQYLPHLSKQKRRKYERETEE